MSPGDHFGVDYADARRRFLGRCAAAGIEVEHRLHPERGHRGEELAVDCARLGPWDAPRVFLTLSATHGVEGFCGSGVQAGALASGLYEPLPPGVAVVLIHAVNPHGFSWLRRVDHENVDLNRNHIDHRRPRPANPGYELLKDAICPAAWTAEARQAAGARLAAYAARHGAMALRTAVSGGQYSHAEGLFFGGRAPLLVGPPAGRDRRPPCRPRPSRRRHRLSHRPRPLRPWRVDLRPRTRRAGSRAPAGLARRRRGHLDGRRQRGLGAAHRHQRPRPGARLPAGDVHHDDGGVRHPAHGRGAGPPCAPMAGCTTTARWRATKAAPSRRRSGAASTPTPTTGNAWCGGARRPSSDDRRAGGARLNLAARPRPPGPARRGTPPSDPCYGRVYIARPARGGREWES